MEPERSPERLRSFLLGGLLGASAVLATARRRRRRAGQRPAGLAAFEDAPCYRELADAERLRSRES